MDLTGSVNHKTKFSLTALRRGIVKQSNMEKGGVYHFFPILEIETNDVFSSKKIQMPTLEQALPGRDHPIKVPEQHYVNGNALSPPFPSGMGLAMFGLGCFWGAEKKFWELAGIYSTSVGYAGGYTPNPSYQEVCAGRTGHNEVVRVVFDPALVSYPRLLKLFWESHNPTQGMCQGNDIGTQYRSGIYVYNAEQKKQAEESLQRFQQALLQSGYARNHY